MVVQVVTSSTEGDILIWQQPLQSQELIGAIKLIENYQQKFKYEKEEKLFEDS